VTNEVIVPGMQHVQTFDERISIPKMSALKLYLHNDLFSAMMTKCLDSTARRIKALGTLP
jgi:hypothetical protein